MPGLLATSIAFLVLFGTFWIVQLLTRFFSTRYFLQLGMLFAITALSVYLLLILLSGPAAPITLALAIMLGGVSIYHGVLFFIKFRESDTRYRWIHKANRAVVQYSNPHERLTIRTDDGVRLQVIKQCSPECRKDKAIIICHGAGRSKNTLPIVQTSAVLATKYDVFTFDFRGHMESGGVFRADGDTELDLKAVIDYLKREGYQKIAIFGWSIGAWTALLSAARGRAIDAIIAAAPVPYPMTRLMYIRSLSKIGPLQVPLLPGISVVRSMWVMQGNHTLDAKDFIANLPAIPILLVYNEYDYTLKVTAGEFEEVFANMPPGSEKMCLPGTGHIFDWPNTYFLWNKLFDWLEARL